RSFILFYFIRQIRIINKKGHTNGFFITIPFSFHAMFAEEHAVFAHQYDNRIFSDPQFIQFLHHVSNHIIHACYQPVIILYVFLVQLRSSEQALPPGSSKIGICPKECRKLVPVFWSSGYRPRYHYIFIIIFIFWLNDISGRISILLMRRLKTYRKTKGFFTITILI